MSATLSLLVVLATTPSSTPDFSSIDGTVAALYDVLSGPVEKQRDWDQFLSIFAPGAMLRAIVPARGGAMRLVEMKPEEYVENGKRIFAQTAFYEREISRKQEVYGSIANVWSTYEARNDPVAKPMMRGINNISLRFDAGRWWIVGIVWQQETPDQPLPKQYLPD